MRTRTTGEIADRYMSMLIRNIEENSAMISSVAETCIITMHEDYLEARTSWTEARAHAQRMLELVRQYNIELQEGEELNRAIEVLELRIPARIITIEWRGYKLSRIQDGAFIDPLPSYVDEDEAAYVLWAVQNGRTHCNGAWRIA
jgi:hypothetical protein